jgi:HipA-like C-terminal domain
VPTNLSSPTPTLQAQQDALRRAITRGPASVSALAASLQVSQPTLSRAIHRLSNEVIRFRITGQRTPFYAVTRSLPGQVNPSQKIYRIDVNGSITSAGTIHCLAGGKTLIQTQDADQLYEGLPPAMAFAAPSGFLGRQVAHSASAALQLPTSLKDWSDDHRIACLVSLSVNFPGDLVFGDAALEREMAFRQTEPVRESEKIKRYDAMVLNLQEAGHGSSAGGEQPKFLCLTEQRGHVTVKFALVGTRMAELLPLEHLALKALDKAGIQAAQTQLLHGAKHAYLEIERFDRRGRFGRLGLLSAGALDDEIFGQRDNWSAFAERCESAGLLGAEHARRIHTMAAFSELIGNTDRHFENISLFVNDQGRPTGVTPAYDILPMKYAPMGGGVDPDWLPIAPKLGPIGGRPDVWRVAYQAASEFWAQVTDRDICPGVSPQLRKLAAKNLRVVEDFAQPFVSTTG